MIDDILLGISINWPALLVLGFLAILYFFFLYGICYQSAERRKAIDERTKRIREDYL